MFARTVPGEEHPPLGKPYIIGFSEGDNSYPILAVAKDARLSITPPTFGATTGLTTEAIAAYPTNLFTHVQQVNEQRVLWVYEKLPGPEVITKGYDIATGAKTRVVRQRVLASTAPTALDNARTIDTIPMRSQDSTVVPEEGNANVALLTTVYQQLPTSAIGIWDQDPETLAAIETTYEVIRLTDQTEPTPTPGTIIEYQKIDSTKVLKITRYFSEFLDLTYGEQRFASFTFPALFDYTLYAFTDECGAFSQIRASFSAMVKTRVEITFVNNGPDEIDGLTLIPKTLMLGRGVQIHSDVLVDAGDYTYTGDCTATPEWTASDPDYSTYIGTIQDTEQLVAGESVLWKAGLHRTMKVYVTML